MLFIFKALNLILKCSTMQFKEINFVSSRLACSHFNLHANLIDFIEDPENFC